MFLKVLLIMRLNNTQDEILDTLGRVSFATAKQLATFCGVVIPSVSKALSALEASNIVIKESFIRPNVWRLTNKGAAILDINLPSGKRDPSSSVLRHTCHRNQVEIEFNEKYGNFRLYSRLSLLKNGLRPAFGEHAGGTKAGRTFFILLDDYLMPSSRIKNSWTRTHKPDGKYYEDTTGRKWNEVANEYFVITTDSSQFKRHKKWIKNNNIAGCHVMKTEPLWKALCDTYSQ